MTTRPRAPTGHASCRIALRCLGTPDDVAYAVTFLASEQAAYITGTVNVSGGLYT